MGYMSLAHGGTINIPCLPRVADTLNGMEAKLALLADSKSLFT